MDQARGKGAEYVVLVRISARTSVPVWSSGSVSAHMSGVNIIIDGHSHEQYTRIDKNKNGEDVLVQ